MKLALGFQYSGVHAGIKPNRKDLALVFSQTPCAAAACLTQNRAKAAPVLDAEARLPSDAMHAVVLNSGNANALTGSEGVQDVKRVNGIVAELLRVPPASVLSASTGVIGVRLPVHKVTNAAPELVRQLGQEPEAAAEAIMTTDTRMKMASRVLTLGGQTVTLTAICKGSGMIAPQMATMIAVVTTDCAIAPALLQQALRAAMVPSFNSLTVDNDMSTNDAVFALANGLAKNPRIEKAGPDFEAFSAALQDLCVELAREIATDGEGATKLFEVRVTGAPSDEIARDLAKAIAGSSLVKAAIFGADPNWGRILATVGARAGSQGFTTVDPYSARVVLQEMTVYDGGPRAHDAEALRARMRHPTVKAHVTLVGGQGQADAFGCDLSYDYVKINADYTSLIVQKPDGGVAKDDRLTNYSSSFKVRLLVEALSYISRFSGKRCVIKLGGEAMVKESLKRAFCNDVMLLRSAGLFPVIVHGGGPEVAKTLTRLGKDPALAEGLQLTDASDVKVLQMVLNGSVNSELVTLLNRGGGHAVGVSGTDGGLLRARKVAGEHGQDLGQVGEVTAVNKAFLEMLLQQGYLPVISPMAMGEDGHSYHLDADAVASEVASALGAHKLIYLSDAPGILEAGNIVSELSLQGLQERLTQGVLAGGMKRKAQALARALQGGVQQAHIIDGRTPHTLVAELFTDHGVGTLVSLEGTA